jgi:hypothetical protein
VWIALVVVAPVVIAGARRERRAEAARQQLPITMTNELLPAISKAVNESGAGHFRTWHNLKPEFPGSDNFQGDAFGVVDIDTSMWPVLDGDVLVYWSDKATSPGTITSEGPLPDDAILLGVWPVSGTARFEAPEAVTLGRSGALLWYSLTHAAVVKSRRVADMTWTER